jgi:hypothetical protein
VEIDVLVKHSHFDTNSENGLEAATLSSKMSSKMTSKLNFDKRYETSSTSTTESMCYMLS